MNSPFSLIASLSTDFGGAARRPVRGPPPDPAAAEPAAAFAGVRTSQI